MAGLIEGDGYIFVPNTINSKSIPHIEIAFDIKDIYLFSKIQTNVGGGFITIRPNGNSGRLIVRKKSVLLNLIRLINGHMRTPKIEALHRLIN